MALLGWKELTRQNIRTIEEIFKYRDLDLDTRLRFCELAYHMIRDDRFDSPSAKWNAFHNALRIIVCATTDALTDAGLQARDNGAPLTPGKAIRQNRTEELLASL